MALLETPSPNFNDRPAGGVVDILVMHYTGMVSGAAALERLCDPAFEVSAHYLVEEDGAVHRLVAEDKRAWHAGVASWRGDANINDRSVGIEIVNPGHEYGYVRFPDAQMAAVRDLALGILGRHPIPARNVVGHSDVAPARKQDPGELFDWAAMAAAGVGLWPAADAPAADGGDAAVLLARIGYDVSDLEMALAAFQRRFRPAKVDGTADAETRRRLAQVAAML